MKRRFLSTPLSTGRLQLARLFVLLVFLAFAPQTSDYPLATASGSVQRGPVPTVETVQFDSKLLNATLPYNVILPPDYRLSRATRYPVLYLLHGVTGHYSDWITHSNVADYAAQHRMIVVMPEGNNGWYTNSATAPADKYETYILRELIPDVQRRYRTIEARYGRAVAGLSMGGYGALKFGLKFPDMFVFAGSMSGALGATAWTENDLKDPGAIRDSVLGVFGPAGSQTRKANDIFEIVRGLTPSRVTSLPYLYLDCGTEDGLISFSQQFAALLSEKKIAHEYRESPGNHNWAYWDQQVPEVLKIAARHLRMPPSTRSKRKLNKQIGRYVKVVRKGAGVSLAYSPFATQNLRGVRSFSCSVSKIAVIIRESSLS